MACEVLLLYIMKLEVESRSEKESSQSICEYGGEMNASIAFTENCLLADWR